jgi:hypothetical protein
VSFNSKCNPGEPIEDLEFCFQEKRYTTIYNQIDTDLFCYKRKSADEWNKLFYMIVKALQLLSEKPWFKDMKRHMIGGWPLLEETLASLQDFKTCISIKAS